MAEDAGLTKLKADTTNVVAHFLFEDQFFGFEGSSGPSQSTHCTSSGRSMCSKDMPLACLVPGNELVDAIFSGKPSSSAMVVSAL